MKNSNDVDKNKIYFDNQNKNSNNKQKTNKKKNKIEKTFRINIISKLKEDEYSENTEKQESITPQNYINNNEMNSNDEQEYLTKIEGLKKILQSEREKSKQKSQENTYLSFELKRKINLINKEILTYVKINDKQREKLTSLNKDLIENINKMNFKNITKKIKRDQNKLKKTLNTIQLVDSNISTKEKQLKNIMSLIEILTIQNENLKQELQNTTSYEKIHELIDERKTQDQKIISISNQIKIKKSQLLEHVKCDSIKEDLLKKIENIKIEINHHHEKFVNSKEKLELLENKIKTKSKNITNEKNNIDQENNNNNLIKSANILKRFPIERNFSDDILISSKEKTKRYVVPVQKSINTINENDLVNIPPKLSEIFTERELKAMLFGIGKNKYKYEKILKKFSIQNSFIDSLESKHKLDVKQKLNKINELDERIEFMYMRKGVYNSNIESFKKQIENTKQEKKIMDIEINKINNELLKRKKIIAKKNEAIKLLGVQLLKQKKLIKKGEIETINDEPDFQIKKNNNENNNGKNKNEDAMTKNTRYNENCVNNIKSQQYNFRNNNNYDDNNSVNNDDKSNNLSYLFYEEDSKVENE